ncbi:MAG: hypothetical protein LBV55_04100 [Acholeplasmatales bacterium]|jgi:hypothetical protein|nr:hypothetical protein [Acholeplasmatales bacterium]
MFQVTPSTIKPKKNIVVVISKQSELASEQGYYLIDTSNLVSLSDDVEKLSTIIAANSEVKYYIKDISPYCYAIDIDQLAQLFKDISMLPNTYLPDDILEAICFRANFNAHSVIDFSKDGNFVARGLILYIEIIDDHKYALIEITHDPRIENFVPFHVVGELVNHDERGGGEIIDVDLPEVNKQMIDHYNHYLQTRYQE